jgi:hypothetical protein
MQFIGLDVTRKKILPGLRSCYVLLVCARCDFGHLATHYLFMPCASTCCYRDLFLVLPPRGTPGCYSSFNSFLGQLLSDKLLGQADNCKHTTPQELVHSASPLCRSGLTSKKWLAA